MRECAASLTVIVDPGAFESISAQAVMRAPAEICGILIGARDPLRWSIERAVESPNVTKGDQTSSYRLDSRLVVEMLFHARRTGKHLLGFYHSHPGGATSPSARDREQAWPDKAYLIVGVANAMVTGASCWHLPGAGSDFVEDRLLVKPC